MNAELLLFLDEGAVWATFTIASSISFSTGLSEYFLTLCLFSITSKKSMVLYWIPDQVGDDDLIAILHLGLSPCVFRVP